MFFSQDCSLNIVKVTCFRILTNQEKIWFPWCSPGLLYHPSSRFLWLFWTSPCRKVTCWFALSCGTRSGDFGYRPLDSSDICIGNASGGSCHGSPGEARAVAVAEPQWLGDWKLLGTSHAKAVKGVKRQFWEKKLERKRQFWKKNWSVRGKFEKKNWSIRGIFDWSVRGGLCIPRRKKVQSCNSRYLSSGYNLKCFGMCERRMAVGWEDYFIVENTWEALRVAI